jgi:protein-S-isoprenylcysteine O-methyltransferase Ste14
VRESIVFDRVVDFIVHISGRERSTGIKVLAVAVGATIFLVLLPWLGIYLGYLFSRAFSIPFPRWLEVILGAASILTGCFWLAWSFVTQWRIGRGTPAPIAAPQRLIVRGPYRLCRNPIELGALLYYFGLGAVLVNLTAGLFVLAVFWILGSAYHKFIEEKELLIRFGPDYEAYRRQTPFLIPRPWSRGPDRDDHDPARP